MATAKKTKSKKTAASAKRARSGQGNGKSNGHGRSFGEASVDTALADLSVFDDLGGEELVGSSLSYAQRQMLGRVARFLSGIVVPRYLRRAVGSGYSREEHEELWKLYITAAGRDQPLAFAFAAFENEGSNGQSAVLAQLDTFENEWLPKARAIIERRVPEANVERFLQAFFKDLTQQRLGPLVIDSAATFLDRVEALASSKEPGADVVLSNLRARGLTESKIASVRALVAQARSGRPTQRKDVDPEAWQAAQDRQAKALRELQLAWSDWGTTLRPLFNVPEQIQLGLSEVRVRAEPQPAPTPGPDAPVPS